MIVLVKMICRLFPNGDGGNGLESTDKPAAPIHPFHPKLVIRRGILSSECADIMQQFFQLRRKKKEKKQKDQEPSTPPSCLPVSHHPSKFLIKMHDVFHLMFCLWLFLSILVVCILIVHNQLGFRQEQACRKFYKCYLGTIYLSVDNATVQLAFFWMFDGRN